MKTFEIPKTSTVNQKLGNSRAFCTFTEMKAIEIKTITKCDGSISVESTGLKGGIPVRVLILSEEGELEEKKYRNFLSNNPALDFLNEPEEDVYTDKDGKPFKN